MLEITPDQVVAVVSDTPRSVGDLGVELAVAHGADRGSAEGEPVGQWLAAHGISLSAVQKLLDGLVHERLVKQVRGRDLWAIGLPTAGTRAHGRYYLSPA